jgi:hypothetical protein
MRSLTLTVALILSVTFCVTAQTPADYDSLKAKILKMDVAINNLHVNVTRYQNQTKAGSIITLVGAVITTVYLVDAGHPNDDSMGVGKSKRYNTGLLYAGSGLMAAGAVVSFDALKHLKRGGRSR